MCDTFDMSNGRQRVEGRISASDLVLIQTVIARTSNWQEIASAPRDGTIIKVRCSTEDYTQEFKAKWVTISDSREDGDGYGWQAENEGEHPACWHDGICWENNADECPSNHPTHWMLLPRATEVL